MEAACSSEVRELAICQNPRVQNLLRSYQIPFAKCTSHRDKCTSDNGHIMRRVNGRNAIHVHSVLYMKEYRIFVGKETYKKWRSWSHFLQPVNKIGP